MQEKYYCMSSSFILLNWKYRMTSLQALNFLILRSTNFFWCNFFSMTNTLGRDEASSDFYSRKLCFSPWAYDTQKPKKAVIGILIERFATGESRFQIIWCRTEPSHSTADWYCSCVCHLQCAARLGEINLENNETEKSYLSSVFHWLLRNSKPIVRWNIWERSVYYSPSE